MKGFTFLLFLSVILFSSCRIEKRLYSSGFYIERKGKSEKLRPYSNEKLFHADADSAVNDSVIATTDTLFPAKASTEILLVTKLKKEICKPLHKMQSSPVYQHLPDPVKKSKVPELISDDGENTAQESALIVSVLGLIAVLVLLGLLAGLGVELSLFTFLLALLSPFIILAAIGMGFWAISEAIKDKGSPAYSQTLKFAIGAFLLALVDFLLFFLVVYLFLI